MDPLGKARDGFVTGAPCGDSAPGAERHRLQCCHYGVPGRDGRTAGPKQSDAPRDGTGQARDSPVILLGDLNARHFGEIRGCGCPKDAQKVPVKGLQSGDSLIFDAWDSILG